MLITGTFKDVNNTKTYNITISKVEQGQTQDEYTIKNVTDADFNDTKNTVLFSTDPVHITTDYSDTFVHNIVKSASINLVTNFNLRDLVLASNNNDITMTITCNGSTIFDGYVEPLCFSEPYASFWNEIEITANDKLSSAQYIKYPQIILDKLNQMSIFLTPDGSEETGIINDIANELGLNIDTTGLSAEILNTMQTTKISNTLFAGESPDDWVSCFDVLEEIGRYWGVWFMQTGQTLRLFNWHNEQRTDATESTVPKNLFIDSNTSISTADAYTQVKLSCDIEGSDSIVEFGDDLVSPYPHYAMYLEELVAEGNGSTAASLFKNLILNNETGENTKQPTESYIYKNFCWIKQSDLWDFGPNGYTSLTGSMTQQEILHWLWENPGKGAFVSFGRTDKMSVKDDSPINSIELQDCLIISVRGHADKSFGLESHQETMQTQFNAAAPICSFKGSSKQFTPPDNNTINYLIISGKVFLNKMYAKSGRSMAYNYDHSKKSGDDYDQSNGTLYSDYEHTYQHLVETAKNNKLWLVSMYHNAVPRIGSNEYGCFYTHKFYDGEPGSEEVTENRCLVGDLKQNKYQQTWKYKYSDIVGQGKKIDNTSKIPVLRCQLKIGNKYCIERIDKPNGEGWGEFEWLTEEEAKNINVVDAQGNKMPWRELTIGFNPKIDDYIIGSNYDIQNTIWYYDDVDGTGTAIPIKFSDNLSGEVEFKIIQPMIQYWDSNHERTGIMAWLIPAAYGPTLFPILEQLESIIISGFKIELTSNKGHILNNTENNDLVYASNMNDSYVEEHEDDTKIATMITSTEAADWGVEMIISDSHVANIDDTPFYGFTTSDENVYIKPEQLYVNDYYLEYSKARQIVETGLKINDISWLNNPDKYKFNFGFLEGEYIPIGYDANLLRDSVTFTMKDMTKNTNDDNGQ